MTKLTKKKSLFERFVSWAKGWIAGRAVEPTTWLGLGLVAFLVLPTLTPPFSAIAWWLVVVCGAVGIFFKEKGEY